MITKQKQCSQYMVFLIKKKFSWPPEHKVTVRRNFERRGAAKMSQLLQDVCKDLEYRPGWMGADVWQQLLEHWNSLKFKKTSETNKRNRSSMDGASLHTGGSIPHRLHWKKMVYIICFSLCFDVHYVFHYFSSLVHHIASLFYSGVILIYFNSLIKH